MLTVVLAIWLARREPRRWVRRLGYLALGAVIAQGLLGGLTVLLFLPPAVSVAHACLAQTFFCLTVAIAVVTSRSWRDRAPASLRAAYAASPVARMAAWTGAAVFLQLLIGAVMRHNKAGLAIPDFPLALGRIVPPLTAFPGGDPFRPPDVGPRGRRLRRRVRRPGLPLRPPGCPEVGALALGARGRPDLARRRDGPDGQGRDRDDGARRDAARSLLGSTIAFGFASLAVARRRGNVIPMRPAQAGKAAAWK